jgi:hypothetical protein
VRVSKAQKTLQRLHGTVEEFTDAVINAIGDISKVEALKAIRDYRERWRIAGETSSRAPKSEPAA